MRLSMESLELDSSRDEAGHHTSSARKLHPDDPYTNTRYMGMPRVDDEAWEAGIPTRAHLTIAYFII